MIKNTNKKATIRLKDGRVFKAKVIDKAGLGKILIFSKEYGEMVVDAKCVRNN